MRERGSGPVHDAMCGENTRGGPSETDGGWEAGATETDAAAAAAPALAPVTVLAAAAAAAASALAAATRCATDTAGGGGRYWMRRQGGMRCSSAAGTTACADGAAVRGGVCVCSACEVEAGQPSARPRSHASTARASTTSGGPTLGVSVTPSADTSNTGESSWGRRVQPRTAGAAAPSVPAEAAPSAPSAGASSCPSAGPALANSGCSARMNEPCFTHAAISFSRA